MKSFALINSVRSKFAVVIMATGAELPYRHINEIGEELRHLHVQGAVVFDLLASNGSRSRRFFSTSFDGDKFPPALDLKPVDPEREVREAAASYLQEHFSEFDLTLLTPAMQFAARKGIPL
ncbi:type II toxin-antitoxin system RnlB family antitoxin [Luteimonas sp. TWI1416]|uniref:type II toxin-antitoxin system RnlB family antitoxin n=1 Tax=unclassified Luteimonas TaxID=2629088 RepID=UPI0032095C74